MLTKKEQKRINSVTGHLNTEESRLLTPWDKVPKPNHKSLLLTTLRSCSNKHFSIYRGGEGKSCSEELLRQSIAFLFPSGATRNL